MDGFIDEEELHTVKGARDFKPIHKDEDHWPAKVKRLRAKQCANKKRYRDIEQAKAIIRHYFPDQRIYFCKFCNGYHLTKAPVISPGNWPPPKFQSRNDAPLKWAKRGHFEYEYDKRGYTGWCRCSDDPENQWNDVTGEKRCDDDDLRGNGLQLAQADHHSGQRAKSVG